MPTQRLELTVHGMHCISCAKRVERALAKAEGVVAVKVDLIGKRAVVEYTPGSITEDMLKQTVRDTGFQVPG